MLPFRGGASPRLSSHPALLPFGPHPLQVNERYPKEVEKRQKRLTALSEALASGISTESDLQRLSTQATTLHNQITEIQDRKVAQVGGGPRSCCVFSIKHHARTRAQLCLG